MNGCLSKIENNIEMTYSSLFYKNKFTEFTEFIEQITGFIPNLKQTLINVSNKQINEYPLETINIYNYMIEDMNTIIFVFETLGIGFNSDEIKNKLKTTTVDKVIKEYLKKEEVFFYFNEDTKLLCAYDKDIWEQYGPFLKLSGYNCYKLFGIDKLKDIVEKGASFVD